MGLPISQTASTTGALAKTGVGTLVLTSPNTYSGNTSVTAGQLILNHNLALQNSALDTTGAAGTVTTTVTAPTFGGLTGNTDLAAVITMGYSSVTALTLNPGAGMTNTFSGIIAEGAAGMSLTKNGAGTQVLAGANTYTGGTAVNAGTVALGHKNGFGTADVTLAGGVNFSTTGFDGINASGAIPNAFILSGGNVNMDVSFAARDIWLNASVTGVGGLAVSGDGSRNPGLMLAGAKTFLGGVTLMNGAQVTIDNNASLGSGGLRADGGTGKLRVAANLSALANPMVIAQGANLHLSLIHI